MAGTVQYASHANFFTGMVRDIPRHMIPDGAVYDAQNIVITSAGALAKRSGTTRVLDSATSMAPTQIAAQKSANTDQFSRLYPAAVSGGYVQVGSLSYSSSLVNMSTFTTNIATTDIGIPTGYGDSMVFSSSSLTGSSPTVWVGGADMATAAAASVGSLSVNTASGDPRITVGAGVVAVVAVGGYIHLSNGGSDEYTGRIVSAGGTTITVDPAPIYVPSTPFTNADYYPVLPQVGQRSDGEYVASAGCIGTFTSGGDSRLVIGDVRTVDVASGRSKSHPNRIMWSVREAADATVTRADGLVQATRAAFPQLNYIDIEDIGQVVALVPVGSGNMMVLGTKNCVMLSGYLLTQSGGVANASLSRGGITANIRAFSQQVGCISAASVQRTSAGVFFAANDGVYLTDGATLVNTMTKKIANMWGDLVAGPQVFTFDKSLFDGPDGFGSGVASSGVYGSANINDSHYYVSLASGGFLCDLRSQFGWTRVKQGEVEICASATDPDTTANRVYALKRGATSATSSIDRVIRLDQMIIPSNVPYDVDGTKINSTIVTKAYAEGDPAQKRRYRHSLFTYSLFGGTIVYPSSTTYPVASLSPTYPLLYPGIGVGSFSVTASKGLAADGDSVALGSKAATSKTSHSDVARFDSQALSQAVTYTITTSDYPLSFSVFEVTNGFNALRPGRVV